MVAKGAVSYQLVSTKGQDFPRQKRARDKWLANHPEYVLLETKAVHTSGRKKNRFDWFINNPKKYPADEATAARACLLHGVIQLADQTGGSTNR